MWGETSQVSFILLFKNLFKWNVAPSVTLTTFWEQMWHSPALHLSISKPSLQGADRWGPTEEITVLSNQTKPHWTDLLLLLQQLSTNHETAPHGLYE